MKCVLQVQVRTDLIQPAATSPVTTHFIQNRLESLDQVKSFQRTLYHLSHEVLPVTVYSVGARLLLLVLNGVGGAATSTGVSAFSFSD